jgi:D-alanyl-D-alanine carboxypeptidase
MKNIFRPLYIRVLCLLVTIPFISSCGTSDSGDSYTQQEIQSMVSSQFEQFTQANDLPPHLGILLHMQTPAGTYSVQAGFLDEQVSENTHYRIASVSKTFTAAAIMLLDQEGMLNIDDTITAVIPWKEIPYLPDTDDFAIPYKEKITIRNLLSHRAGVFDIFNDPIPPESQEPYAGMNYIEYVKEKEGEENHQYTLEELISVIAKNQLSYAGPNVLYHYSDVGYMLLAGIIERVTGMRYDQYLQNTFFMPLGLNNTSAPWEANDIFIPEPYFTGYTRWDDKFFITVEDNMSCQVGPGNIISTPKDIALWIRTILSGRGPLTHEQIRRMQVVPEGNTTYALGISKTEFGYGHSGAHPGYMNFVSYNEDHDISVAVVAPFLDYDEGKMDKLYATLNLMIDISEQALEIAKFTYLEGQGTRGSALDMVHF